MAENPLTSQHITENSGVFQPLHLSDAIRSRPVQSLDLIKIMEQFNVIVTHSSKTRFILSYATGIVLISMDLGCKDTVRRSD